MDASSLDALVRIASAGTAGICVLIVFVSGFLIWKLPDSGAEAKISLIKMYMITCIVLAVLSSASGIANFLIKQENVDEAVNEKEKAEMKTEEIASFVAEEIPKIKKVNEDLQRTREMIAENPGRNEELNLETQKTLDSASRTYNSIDFKKLKRVIPDNKVRLQNERIGN